MCSQHECIYVTYDIHTIHERMVPLVDASSRKAKFLPFPSLSFFPCPLERVCLSVCLSPLSAVSFILFALYYLCGNKFKFISVCNFTVVIFIIGLIGFMAFVVVVVVVL